jgi:hypothetical protein
MVARWYEGLLWVIALGLSLGGCFLVGLRGWKLFGGAVALWLPTDILCVYLTGLTIPLPLEPYESPSDAMKRARANRRPKI